MSKIEGLPKGFRFTKENKRKIKTAALRKTFEDVARDILDRELSYAVGISMYLYNPQVRWQYAQGYLAVRRDLKPHSFDAMDLFGYGDGVEISPTGRDSFSLGFHAYWYSDEGVKFLRSRLLRDYAHLANVRLPTGRQGKEELPYVIQPTNYEIRVPEKEVLSLLPTKYRRELLGFVRYVDKVHTDIQQMDYALDRVLLNVTSASKLVEQYPEFLGYIRIAENLPEDPSCSDIPVADDALQISNIADKYKKS